MKRHILVVDDDRAVCESLCKLLKAEGFEISTARNAVEAMEHFGSKQIDLIVLDINLGPDNGWDLFQAMVEINPFVPTVVITAEFGQREQAVDLGAEALIEKPIDVPSFLKTIHEVLAETAKQKLERLCGDENYCRYYPCHYEAFLKDLQKRHSASLELSPGIKSALRRKPKDMVVEP